jgi:hypothetical protein
MVVGQRYCEQCTEPNVYYSLKFEFIANQAAFDTSKQFARGLVTK